MTNAVSKNDEEGLLVLLVKSKNEAWLRNFLLEKPQNAKVTSQLACLLVDQSKTTVLVEPEKAVQLRMEALTLAQRAIRLAPTKPYGYAALSIAAHKWSERRVALIQAAELSDEPFRLARIGLWVRLLLEERKEEALKSKASNKQRALNLSETNLYQRIQDDLQMAWEDCESYSDKEREFLCQQEFRLGQFFRKKLPAELNLPRARHHLEQSRKYPGGHSSEMAAFWLATIQDEGNRVIVMDKCPADYVVGLYSTFAARFDKLLVEQLEYQTPTKLRQVFQQVIMQNNANNKKQLDGICDLGCGTGLSGLAFYDLMANGGRMVGVDLSPEMLKQAKERGCYDELHVGDVETTLSTISSQKVNGSFDLILACDVFCYIGDLAGVFSQVHKALVAGGYFLFSTELWVPKNTDDSRPFLLHSCARFSHQPSYIDELALKMGFEMLQMQTMPIRKNQGRDVQGLLVVLRKPCTKGFGGT